MNIQEVTKLANTTLSSISRESWENPHWIKLFTTNDEKLKCFCGCTSSDDIVGGWNPSADDLMADDWYHKSPDKKAKFKFKLKNKVVKVTHRTNKLNIQEATKKAREMLKTMRRESWKESHQTEIFLTNEGHLQCVVIGNDNATRCWQPTADDLKANDWEICS